MLQDPIIAEIRQIRHEIDAECQNNALLYYEHVLKVQEQYVGQLIRRAPRPALKMAYRKEESSQTPYTTPIENEAVLVG